MVMVSRGDLMTQKLMSELIGNEAEVFRPLFIFPYSISQGSHLMSEPNSALIVQVQAVIAAKVDLAL